MPLDAGVVLDRLHGAHRRFLAGYAEWGGYRFHGWTHQTDSANYLGPVIWSEADCVLRFALELETDFPDQVHCEVKIDTSTRLDFPSDGENARQRVDIGVSDLSEFDAGESAYDAFRSLHHALLVEVKWFQRAGATAHGDSTGCNTSRASRLISSSSIATYVSAAATWPPC